jgi:MFS family permease
VEDSALQSVASDETVAPQIATATLAMPRVVRALRHRGFRLFWLGNLASNVGTWMQNVAQGWLVLKLEPRNPVFWLGVIGFAASAPMLLLTPIGGVVADRMDKRKLMLWTQSTMMVQAFALWWLTYTGRITAPMVVFLAFVNGTAMAMNSPSYQAMVPQLVPREDLGNAIALNAAQFNMARVLGPTLGGFAMAWFGVSGNFLLNAISFVAVLIALGQITYPPVELRAEASVWRTLADGVEYVFGRTDMFTLLLLVAFASVFAIPYIIFVPYFAKQILHLDERGFGLIMAAQGAGAFVGAATIAYISIRHRGRFVVRAGIAFCIFIILFTLSRKPWISGLLLAGVGYCMVLMVATVNTLLQHLSADHMRGRVMSMYATAFLGFAPIGSLLAGSLAGSFGAPAAIAGMSAVALIATLVIYIARPELKNLD